MSKDEIAISVKHVSKSFKLPHEKTGSIKGAFIGMFRGSRTYEKQQVLNDISFDIKKGEFFGIVGRNGSGKSTLLKLLAGIYAPNKGQIQINGKLTPFIELGVGFNPELTGRENVFLNGALLGFNRDEMNAMYDEIVDFAELEKFMDQKLKNYSSGMQVRLAFSIAIRAQTDILILDEVLAVGDAAFQKKCYEHFVLLKKHNKTVVLVTHDMSAVERFCTKAMVIQDGNIKGVLSPREASSLYESLNTKEADNNKHLNITRWGSKDVEVLNISTNLSKKANKNNSIKLGDKFTLSFDTKSAGRNKKIVIGLAFFNQYGVNVSGPNSRGIDLTSNSRISFTIPKVSFNPGKYEVTLVVFDENTVKEYDHIEKAITFHVVSRDSQKHGAIDVFPEWSQNEK